MKINIRFKAILTKFLPCTNYRPARVKAYTDGCSLTLSWEDAWSSDQNHYIAADALRVKMGWPGRLIGGGTKNGRAFVFAD